MVLSDARQDQRYGFLGAWTRSGIFPCNGDAMAEAGSGALMSRFVLVHREFERRLHMLRRSGGVSGKIAEKADQMVGSLGVVSDPGKRLPVRLTRHGEARIRNCLKFDLGNGYRILSVREGSTFYILFIGTHEECDNWLKRNTGYRPDRELETRCRARLVEKHDPNPGLEHGLDERDLYEEQIMSRIDDMILRKIFHGFHGERRRR